MSILKTLFARKRPPMDTASFLAGFASCASVFLLINQNILSSFTRDDAYCDSLSDVATGLAMVRREAVSLYHESIFFWAMILFVLGYLIFEAVYFRRNKARQKGESTERPDESPSPDISI